MAKIPKGLPTSEEHSTSESTSLEDIQISVKEEPKASPEDRHEQEAAAGTIQKAFRKYQTSKASKRVAEDAFSAGDT